MFFLGLVCHRHLKICGEEVHLFEGNILAFNPEDSFSCNFFNPKRLVTVWLPNILKSRQERLKMS